MRLYEESGFVMQNTADAISRLSPNGKGELAPVLVTELADLPLWVKLQPGRVVWSVLFPHRESKPRPKPLVSEDALRQFLELRNARDIVIKEFVERWGPLWLCEKHSRPVGHPWVEGVETTSGHYVERIIGPYDDMPRRADTAGNEFSEKVDDYRKYSQFAFELLWLAASLRSNKPIGAEDWPDMLVMARKRPKPTDPSLRAQSDKPWLLIRNHLDWWLACSPVRPVVRPAEQSVSLQLGAISVIRFNPLFALLGLQLVSSIAGAGVGICAKCTKPFPTKKSEEGYCPTCRKRFQWSKASKKLYDKRKKVVQPSKRKGTK
jgi:hypothetical protein